MSKINELALTVLVAMDCPLFIPFLDVRGEQECMK